MDFFKKNAGSKIEVRNQHSQKHLKEMYLPDPIRRIPTEGYVTIKSVLSDHTAVLFAVPSHEWNELVANPWFRMIDSYQSISYPVIISGSKLKVTMYSGKTIEIVNNINLSYIDFMRLN